MQKGPNPLPGSPAGRRWNCFEPLIFIPFIPRIMGRCVVHSAWGPSIAALPKTMDITRTFVRTRVSTWGTLFLGKPPWANCPGRICCLHPTTFVRRFYTGTGCWPTIGKFLCCCLIPLTILTSSGVKTSITWWIN